MRRQIYYKKLHKVLDCRIFTEIESRTNSLILKVENDIKNTLLEMKKLELISDKVHSKLKTTGAQSAMLQGLADL